MAEVQTSDHGEGGKKNKQKKQHLRVDFTPMVDMNMLLITFFMFCTTLLKPQTMNLNMPSKENDKDPTTQTKVRESTAVTVILGAENTLYYYTGMPNEDGSDYKNPNFLTETTYKADGLRDLLLKKNAGTYEAIQELKAKKEREEITEEVFREESKKVQDEAKKAKKAPTIMIKATELSTYKNLVDVLDEMLICNIGAYAIIDISDGDRYLLYEKTKYGEYLTEKQRAEAARR
ncbi:MAG: biopolymer transporter ExbD [Dysgonamonadaceae bacterium]|jgi:biopolymer transport protein ExbD|nr:biopolymer transporter ExbD [Dysgonamonadaceae bacterium]